MIIRALCAIGFACVAVASVPLAQTSQDNIDITAFAINMSNVGAGRSTVVEIRIDRWSTADERAHLIKKNVIELETTPASRCG